jgi:hypothetical protein
MNSIIQAANHHHANANNKKHSALAKTKCFTQTHVLPLATFPSLNIPSHMSKTALKKQQGIDSRALLKMCKVRRPDLPALQQFLATSSPNVLYGYAGNPKSFKHTPLMEAYRYWSMYSYGDGYGEGPVVFEWLLDYGKKTRQLTGDVLARIYLARRYSWELCGDSWVVSKCLWARGVNENYLVDPETRTTMLMHFVINHDFLRMDDLLLHGPNPLLRNTKNQIASDLIQLQYPYVHPFYRKLLLQYELAYRTALCLVTQYLLQHGLNRDTVRVVMTFIM